MSCPKCGSDNVNFQSVGITKTKSKGCIYWLLIGWWFELLMWFFLTLPMILIKLFGKTKVKTKVKTFAVCQNCGYTWKN